jgi:hypothetical protein
MDVSHGSGYAARFRDTPLHSANPAAHHHRLAINQQTDFSRAPTPEMDNQVMARLVWDRDGRLARRANPGHDLVGRTCSVLKRDESLVESSSCFSFLIEHDLFGKTAVHFSGSC